MAFCIKCGQELSEGAKFCAGCGTEISAEVKNENKQRETIYDGKLHKCPNCGEFLNAFVTVCPVCGYELRGSQTTSCVHELSLKLEKTESIDKKIELISDFYIPNTKEDIYEFFILAYSNITAGSYGIDAWNLKLEQAYLKAKLAFGKSEEFNYINELYDKIKKASLMSKFTKSRMFKALIVFSVGLLMILGGFIIGAIIGTSSYDSTPFLMIGLLGIVPFIVGIIMFIIPEKKRKQKK